MASWYQIFNKTEFEAAGLSSRTIEVMLEGRGRTSIEIYRGNTVAVKYGGAFLPVNFMDRNPYVQGDLAVWVDSNSNVWLGFA